MHGHAVALDLPEQERVLFDGAARGLGGVERIGNIGRRQGVEQALARSKEGMPATSVGHGTLQQRLGVL